VRSREREDGREAWKQSREAYLQWRVHRALATSESGGDAGAAAPAVDEEMTELHRGFGKTGGSRELKVGLPLRAHLFSERGQATKLT
jgi:hypothetical protein